MGLIADIATLEVQRHPFFLRTSLGLLRRSSPVFRVGSTLIVTGQPQVREVFSRPKDFLFGFGNGPKMKLGPFLFGMDASRQYFDEKAVLARGAIKDTDIDRFGFLVREHANRVLKEKDEKDGPGRSGRIDLVSEFIEPVLLRAGADFYGVKLDQAESAYVDAPRGEQTYAQWIRKLGGVVGSSWPAPFGLEALANHLAAEMATFIAKQVPAAPSKSVIGTLKELASSVGAGEAIDERPHGCPAHKYRPPASSLPTADDIARCVGGLMLAGAAAIKASTLALHELLGRPSVLPDAVALARVGQARTIEGYAWEALRFRPAFPFLVRYCPRATTLATSTQYETAVPAGARVFISPLAAMFDPLGVERPEEFIPTRPSTTYLHFGFGLHRCFGELLAARAIGELLTCLLAQRVLEAGRIQYEGPAVVRYDVTSRRPMANEVADATSRADDSGANLGPGR
ncbi:MAG TPA: cytochrome P450, partial [Polyangiaceae bacterium]|nr:cytochrome P450 [Polyangiaceae bacterium]